MRLIIATALLALCGTANAQVAGFSDVPQTHWAAEAVSKVSTAGIVRGYPVAQNPKAAGQTKYDGNKPVTRYELAVTLYRFILYVERAERQPKGNLKVEAPIDPKEAVRKMIAEGYLPANTPLARDGNKAVTADELSEAMTQVLTRIQVKKTPITPDSEKDTPIRKPANTGTR